MRIGLRLRLGEYLGLAPAPVPIVLSREGKSRIGSPDQVVQIGFSLSHAGRYGLLAFVRGRQAGVDFEAIQHQSGLDEVATRFFAFREQVALKSWPRTNRCRPSTAPGYASRPCSTLWEPG